MRVRAHGTGAWDPEYLCSSEPQALGEHQPNSVSVLLLKKMAEKTFGRTDWILWGKTEHFQKSWTEPDIWIPLKFRQIWTPWFFSLFWKSRIYSLATWQLEIIIQENVTFMQCKVRHMAMNPGVTMVTELWLSVVIFLDKTLGMLLEIFGHKSDWLSFFIDLWPLVKGLLLLLKSLGVQDMQHDKVRFINLCDGNITPIIGAHKT